MLVVDTVGTNIGCIGVVLGNDKGSISYRLSDSSYRLMYNLGGKYLKGLDELEFKVDGVIQGALDGFYNMFQLVYIDAGTDISIYNFWDKFLVCISGKDVYTLECGINSIDGITLYRIISELKVSEYNCIKYIVYKLGYVGCIDSVIASVLDKRDNYEESRLLIHLGVSYYVKVGKYNKRILSISNSIPKWFKRDIGKVKEFVPNWDIVDRYKRGIIGTDEYKVRYLRQLDSTFKSDNELIDLLKVLNGSILFCYERDGSFCHRNILMDYLSQRLVDKVIINRLLI